MRAVCVRINLGTNFMFFVIQFSVPTVSYCTSNRDSFLTYPFWATEGHFQCHYQCLLRSSEGKNANTKSTSYVCNKNQLVTRTVLLNSGTLQRTTRSMLVNKFPTFIETELPFLCWQNFTFQSYPESSESKPCSQTLVKVNNTWHKFWSFAVPKFNEMFLDRQLCQDVKVLHCFMDWLHPHLQSVAGALVEPKLTARCPTVLYISLFSLGMGRNGTPLVSGKSQEVIALGLGCLKLVV